MLHDHIQISIKSYIVQSKLDAFALIIVGMIIVGILVFGHEGVNIKYL